MINFNVQDRCHRIGQTKTVRVYKLVSEDTVDEDIFDMGERKKKLSAAVLADCSKQGQVSASEDGDEISSIGKILQNALLRVNRHK